jgi:carboxypeptidase C (cathepsin A)
MKRLFAGLALVALAGCGGGGGGSATTAAPPPPPTTSPFFDPVFYSSAGNSSLDSAQEMKAVTQSQIVIGGATYNYTATAGHLTARDLTSNAPAASFFYVAYTVDNANAATRPVTFFYNGGPGSATVWLHLGSFGPKRIQVGYPATTQQAPFPFVDNAESLLDASDLVFVDAIGTGFSEAISPYTNRSFWGVDADAAIFRDFVRRYVEANNRGASPKFLFGESYGTPRSAVMANLLETAGVSLKGVVLQSSVLDYNANCGVGGSAPLGCSGYLPTYGATGAWFNLSRPTPALADIPGFVAQLRTLTAGRYQPAMATYLQTFTVSDAALVTQLADVTGMTTAQWSQNFNMYPSYFQSSLIAGTLIGRYDARVTAPVSSALARDGDPSSTFITAPFTNAITTYLGNTLRYTNASSYVVSGSAINAWNFSHDGRGLPDTVPDLAAAMTLNPKLKVFSVNGYHDLATPFFITEQDLARLGPNPNLVLRFYMGGHMTYLDDQTRVQQKADLLQFYQAAVAPGSLKIEVAPKSAAVPLAPRVSGVEMPAATMEMPLHDPYVPPEVAKAAAARVPFEDLRVTVTRKLKGSFDAADKSGTGTLTRAQAEAAGLGFVAANFDAIDRARRGSVTFEDLKQFLREQGAKLD